MASENTQAFSGVEKRGKRKSRTCDLEGEYDVECDYELNGVRVISEYLEKNTALFLLNFFTGVYANIGKSKAVSSDERSKSKLFELPTLEAKVDVKVLPMAWNTAHPPREDRHCDLEGCIDPGEVSCILICGHAYHFECFLLKLESQCRYCADFLISGIEDNCKAFQKTLDSPSNIKMDEDVNEKSGTETSDDTNISVEDLSLENNIDLLIERAINVLTSA
jgi:hypothetical protein